MRRRMEEANAAQAAKATVSIRRVDAANNAVPLVAERLQLPPGCVATAVHGGALLGVNVRSTAGGDEASGQLSRPSVSTAKSEAGESAALSGGAGGGPPKERLLFFDWSGRLQGDGAGGASLSAVLRGNRVKFACSGQSDLIPASTLNGSQTQAHHCNQHRKLCGSVEPDFELAPSQAVEQRADASQPAEVTCSFRSNAKSGSTEPHNFQC